MDAEPGRCRRTDGQKWRCRLAVLPDKKYCERHVNRGRNRSRKPVEVNQTLLKSKSKSIITTSVSLVKAAPNLESSAKTNAEKVNKVGIKDQSFKIKKISRENALVPLELSFFAESVLQGDNVQGCETSIDINSSTPAVAESVRCRRTDGRKWRCSKQVLPDQKYCVDHMNRGIKKVENNGQKSNTSYQKSGDHANPSNDDNGSDANGGITSCGSDADTKSI